MKAVCNGFLLDESKGEFKNDQGETIAYHSARIYNTIGVRLNQPHPSRR